MNGKLQCECGRIIYGEPCPKCDGEGSRKRGVLTGDRTPSFKYSPSLQSVERRAERSEGSAGSRKSETESKKIIFQPAGQMGKSDALETAKRAQAIRRTFAGPTYARGSIRG